MMTNREAEKKGWRILAGYFFEESPEEMAIADGIVSFIKETGGRAAIVTHGYMCAVYRPELEMESIEQTERRIERAGLLKAKTTHQ